jgi:hypothetical protein
VVAKRAQARGTGLLVWLAIGAAVVVALGVRLYQIDEPPLDFQPERQLHGAILARWYYLKTQDSAPLWKKRVAERSARDEGIVGEPPVMEFVASQAYRVAGGEQLWIPRTLSTLLWLVGGVFLFLIARRLASLGAVLCAVTFYLFAPFGVSASRSFQPDPLMVALILATVLAILRYHERPSAPRLIAAGVIAALALLVKPIYAVFPTAGALLALSVARQGVRRTLTDPHVYIFGAIALLPSLAYYLWGTVLDNFLEGRAGGRVLPELLVESQFWRGWLHLATHAVGGTVVLLAGLAGIVLARGTARALIVGLWLGYLAFGLTYTYPIYTHDYYSLQLVPIVALSLLPLADRALRWLNGLPRVPQVAIAAVVVAVALVAGVAELRRHADDVPRMRQDARTYAAIGDGVDHSRSVIFLDTLAAAPLRYYAWIAGAAWPSRGDMAFEELSTGTRPIDAQKRLSGRSSNHYPNRTSLEWPPKYFVVRNFAELEQQADLQRLLERYPRLVQTREYVIYDLRRGPLTSPRAPGGTRPTERRPAKGSGRQKETIAHASDQDQP